MDEREVPYLSKLQNADLILTHMSPRGAAGVNNPTATYLCVNSVGRRPVNLLQPSLHASNCKLTATVAALASLAAIVLLLFVCRQFKASVTEPGFARRRLSNAEDSSRSELRRVCTGEALESDSGASVRLADEQARGQGPPEPAAELPKLATKKRHAGANSQPMSLSSSHVEAAARVPSFTTRGAQLVLVSESGLLPAQARHFMKRLKDEQAGASTSDSGPASSSTLISRSADELEAAGGLILLQAQAPQDASSQYVTASSSQVAKQKQALVSDVHVSAGISGAHEGTVSYSGFTKPQPQIALQLPLLLFSSDAGERPAKCRYILPSARSGSPSQAVMAREREQHFARLPSVPRPGKYQQRFDPKRAVEKWKRSRPQSVPLLHSYREVALLLIRESLSLWEMEMLGRMATDLAATIRNKEFPDLTTKRKDQAVVHTGTCFLALSALVSALHVLEVSREESWWGEVIGGVHHSYEPADEEAPGTSSVPGTYAKNQARFNANLTRQLRRAISTLKKGTLPEKQQLIDLNKLLFFHKFSPTQISESNWNIWKALERDASSSQ